MLQGFGMLPGVQSSGLTSDYYARAEGLRIEGRPEPRPGEPRPLIAAISSNYFASMRIPVLRGRSISDRDRPGSPRVAVISNAVARHYWPHSDAIGRRVKLDAATDWLTVVGVAGDVVDDWFNCRPTPAMYVSYAQFPNSHAEFVLRTPGDPKAVAKAARIQIQTVDPALGVYELKTMEQSNYEQRGGVHAAAMAMTTYAAVALLLAVTGIYAVISYFVAARTHDIGVHVALGATRADVLRLTLRQTMRLILTGLAVGAPLAIALARLMSSALFNVVRLEPFTFLMFTAILVAAGLLASYVPTRRAARIDPMVALRNE